MPCCTCPLDLQVKRLDVEHGDMLVLTTAKKLTQAQADAAHDLVAQLARRHGVRDVSVLVLDNCSDLTVERRERPAKHRGPGDPGAGCAPEVDGIGAVIASPRFGADRLDALVIRARETLALVQQIPGAVGAATMRMQHQAPQPAPIVTR